MEMEKYKAQLEMVEKAIEAILAGAQSYTIDNRTLTRANLATLYKERDWLLRMISTLDGGGTIFTTSVFSRR